MERSITFVIEGEVNTQVRITEQADGTLLFELEVLDTGSIGDLRALFFDLAPGYGGLVDGLTVDVGVEDVTSFSNEEDSVDTLGQGANIKGSVSNELGDFDVGVEFGTSGMATDDIQSTSFVLDHESQDLTLDMFSLVDFGIRLTSVGEDGGSRTGSVKIGDQSSAAITAFNDALDVDEGAISAVLNVFDNDSPSTGLTITEATSGSTALSLVAANAVTTLGGRHGSLSVAADGSVGFDATGQDFDSLALGETDTVVVNYNSVNGEGSTDWAEVIITITGTNDAPTAVADVNGADTVIEQGFTVAGDATATGNVLTNDTDLDTSDTLSVTALAFGASVVTPANPGDSLSLTGAYGSLLFGANGVWSYQLDNNDPDTDALAAGDVVTEIFTYTVSDGNGGTDTATLTITINGSDDNAPPVANDDALTVDEDVTTVLDVLGNDTDANGQTLSVAKINGTAVSVGDTVTTTHGSLTVNANGTLSYTGDAHYGGADSFTYVASDGLENSGTATVDLTVAPVADAPLLALTSSGGGGDLTPQPIGADVQVNTYTTSRQENASVAALGDGGFLVTWSSLGQDGTGQGIYAQRYNANGTTFGAEFRVNSHTSSDQLYSDTTALSDGGFLVTWSSLGQDGSGRGIYAQRYNADGTTDGAEFRVNTHTSSDQLYSDTTALDDGGFLVTWSSWSQDGNGWGIYGQRYNASGAVVGGEFRVNSQSASHQIFSDITTLSDGGFLVAWSGQDGSSWGINAQRYDAAGATVGGEFQVNTFTSNEQLYPDTTALSDGGYVVTWSSHNQIGSDWGIYGQRYSADGTANGGEFQVNTLTTENQLVSATTALDDGGFLVTWSSWIQDGSGYGIYAQRYDAAGVAVGSEYRIDANTTESQFTDGFNGSDNVATLADGRVVTVWDQDVSNGEIFYRITDIPSSADGTEDQPMAVNLAASLNDTDGSESLTLTLSGFPASATFNLGSANGANWVITGAESVDLSTLTMTPPPNWNGTFTLTVTATATETANGDTASTIASAVYTIEAVNDVAVIGGVAIGGVTEDDDPTTLSTGGALTISDVDTGEAVFVAQAATPGTNSLGVFTLDASGNWTYAADNTQAVIQSLGEGATLIDSFTAVSLDGSASQLVTVTITGVGDDLPAIELAELELDSDTRGFAINGVSSGDEAGFSVRNAGDVNGDGLDDLIIGARRASPNGFQSGATFVVFGKADGTAVELSDVEAGIGGFVMNGVSSTDLSGFSVSGAGDVNGDGLSDIIVGSLHDDPNGLESGTSFVVFGKNDSTTVELSDIESGLGGFAINGVSTFDYSGWSVSGGGDINGDGFSDLIVGAWNDDPNGIASGATFVVFGKPDGNSIELSAVEAGNGGFVINGVSAGDFSGRQVSDAGDVDGDGYDDLIVGARGGDPNGSNSGASFVVFGQTDGTPIELSDVENGIGGFVINGVSTGDNAGASVSGAGDVNGDGYNDLIVGAIFDDPNGSNSGASFVIFGKTDGTAVELSDVASGVGGFVINGVAADDQLGFEINDAGDVNGDGYDDLIVGARLDDPNGSSSGASFVVFGKTDGTAVELSDIESGIGGFVINGASSGDFAGRSVSAAGDVNGDGFDDIIVGARTDDPNGSSSGASFVIFGGDFTGAATQIGTAGADTLTGTGADDVLIAGTGDDTLVGAGGEDVLRGGEGDDVLAISDLAFTKLDGGTGSDTLRLDGAGLSLDLTAIADPVIDEIERIDLNAGGNSVTFDKLEVLRLSGSTNTVRVLGDGGIGDAVTLLGGLWMAAGSETDADGTFDIFTDGLARVEIEQGLGLTGGPPVPIAPIELSELELDADSRGFVINGVSTYDISGVSVSSAGDVNGDGYDDVIVGAKQDDPNGSNSGASFIVFGKVDGTTVELSDIETGSGGFAINGVSAGDVAGVSVSSAGDVNGDGLDDLIIGATGDDPNGSQSGASFVVFGKTDGTAVELSDVEAGNGGFVINGVSVGDASGWSVSGAGDVNDDGLDDLIVGAVNENAGYVVFGKTDGTTVELSDIEAGNGGFLVNGTPGGIQFGRSVSSAGDVNGDGLDDLIVGGPEETPHGSESGASFVVFGKTDGTAVEASDIEAGSGGFVINGVSMSDRSGFSVSSAGDVNGDGLDDLIVGAYLRDINGTNSGASYVVFGKTDGTTVELSDVEGGGGGFAITGVSGGDFSGVSVSTAGDVNGDGLDDLIIGASGDDPNGSGSGASFVVFGKADSTTVELSDIEAGNGGFVINGVSATDYTGKSVSGAGDVNADGFDDLIVGAYGDDLNGSWSGASFVIFGGNFTGAATQIGTIGADTLSGTSSNDVIFAGTGNDTVDGGGGTDRLSGGQGDDVFIFNDTGGSSVTVIDFEDGLGGQDMLDVSDFGFAGFAAFLAVASVSGPGGHDTLIQLDANDSVLLEDFDLADLDASDVLLI